jgi:hypothetical protein
VHRDRYSDYHNPTNFYEEFSGTTDGNASGGAFQAITTGAPRTGGTNTISRAQYVEGDFHFFVVAKATSATDAIDVGYYLTTPQGNIYTEDRTITPATTYQIWYLGKRGHIWSRNLPDAQRVLSFAVNFDPGAGTAQVDFVQVINGTLLSITPQLVDIPGGGGAVDAPLVLYLSERSAWYGTDAWYAPKVDGEPIYLEPGIYNHLIKLTGDDGGDHSISSDLTVNYIKIIPRYALT